MPILQLSSFIGIYYDMRLYGQQLLLTTHYQITSDTAFEGPDMNGLFSATLTKLDELGGMTETLAAVLCDNVTIENVVFQALSPTRYVRVKLATAHDVGTVNENALPPNVATAITLRSDDVGRSKYGTKHIGGVPPSFSSGGQITAAARDAYSDLKDALVQPLAVTVDGEDFALKPVVYHRAVPTNSVEITNGEVQLTQRVERRRTVGLGS